MRQVNLTEIDTPDFRTGSITFIGTATVLIRYAGFTILTDPNFLHRGESVHLGYWLRSRRLTDPAIELHDLPSIDCVLLSHLHEDHFDRVVARRLDRTLPITTTPKAADGLAQLGFERAYGLDTWDALALNKGPAQVRVTAMPGRHGPALVSQLLPPVMGSMVEFYAHHDHGQGSLLFRLYITGDTLVHRALEDIPRRYPMIDQALLHLGGTRLLGLLVTMDAAQGVQMLRLLRPARAIPIHYNDYTVYKSPLEDFKQAVRAHNLQPLVHYLEHGDVFRFDIPDTRLREALSA